MFVHPTDTVFCMGSKTFNEIVSSNSCSSRKVSRRKSSDETGLKNKVFLAVTAMTTFSPAESVYLEENMGIS